MVPALAHMLQKIILLQQPYMGKRSRLAAECCFHKFLLGVEGRGFPECPATKRQLRAIVKLAANFSLPIVPTRQMSGLIRRNCHR